MFFLLNLKNPNVAGCQLVRIFRISYGKSVQYGNTIYAIQSTDYEKKKQNKKTKRLQKEIMTGADKLIGGIPTLRCTISMAS